ncbi:MAG: HEAT repeat domain-containing protein, partial [Bacteroidota bacterium]
FMAGEVSKGMFQEIESKNPSLKKSLQLIQSLLELMRGVSVNQPAIQSLVLQLSLLNEWLLIIKNRNEDMGQALSDLDAKFELGKELESCLKRGLSLPGDSNKVDIDQESFNNLLSLLTEASAIATHYSNQIRPLIIQALQNNDARIRRSAVSMMPILLIGDTDTREVFPYCENALRDPDPGVREAVCKILSRLVDQGVDVAHALSIVTDTLIDDMASVRQAAVEAIAYLVEQGASLDVAHLSSLLDIPAADGCLERIKLLVEYGAQIDTPNKYGWEPIHVAADKCHLEVVQYLKEQGEAVNPPVDIEGLETTLKAFYQQPHFKTIASFLDASTMPVEAIECHLKLNEQVKTQGSQDDQLAAREERLQWVKTPIELKDLFKKRSVKPSESVKEITRILLVGEAGTGKTSVTKKLANAWATGAWGLEFKAIYILPKKALRTDFYNGQDYFRHATLATVIANQCFTGMHQANDFEALCRHIEFSLSQPTTLLILDGLDEQYGVSQEILKEARSGNHKLLITSRPYGVETERILVDIEIEHVGFDISQRDRFVHRALDESHRHMADKLLGFIKDHNLDGISQVPVNLEILCTLWKEQGDIITQHKPSFSSFYRKFFSHVWERFETSRVARSENTRSENQSLFEDLEKVALASLQRGEIIIRRSTFEEVLGDKPSPLLKDAGFLLFQNMDTADRVAIDPRYQFPHLTFQEYFAGRSLARKFLLGQQDEVAEFFREHMYVARHKRTLSFMSGEISKGMPQELRLASPKERISPMRDLLRLLNSVPQEILGVQHLLLQLHLLNEWLLVSDQSRMSESLATLEREFGLGQKLITWFNKSLRQYRLYGDKSPQLLNTTLMTLLSEAHGVTKHYGTELRKHTLNALQHSFSYVRIAALQALPPLVEKGAEVQAMVTPILNALQDSDEDVRSAALQALRTLVDKGADVQLLLPPILNALKDSDWNVHSAALQALRTLLEQGADVQVLLPLILNALHDSDWNV